MDRRFYPGVHTWNGARDAPSQRQALPVGGRATVAEAFDREASSYDEGFGRNPMALLFRHVVQVRLRELFSPGSRVLDLGCGTGEDALFLAASGVSVLAIDASPRIVERARVKAKRRGVPQERLRIEVGWVEEAAKFGHSFDGAYSNFGALNCADVQAVGRELARALRFGAPLLLSVLGKHPLPALAERALTGRGEAPRGRGEPRIAGVRVPAHYPTPGDVREAFGASFDWRRTFALGVVVPGPAHGTWACRNPQAFGLLAALEGIVRHWPVLRSLGDHVVLEGVRR